MTQLNVTACACPKCSGQGRSVAAMHYKETKVWEKEGTFSGTGVEVGTGGLGFVVGGGDYSESGTAATKRADTFAEPYPFLLPVGGLIVMGLIIAGVYNSAPDTLSTFFGLNSGPSDGSASGRLADLSSHLITGIKFLAPIVGALVLAVFGKIAWENHRENERTMSKDYPRMLDRYNELRYCEACHVLFDHHGNYENANELGFEKMLDIPFDAN